MSGTMVSSQVVVAQSLRAWHALSVEVHTSLRHSRGSVMNEVARYCLSPKRTKAGVLVDYTVYLASYGVEVSEGSINQLRGALNATGKKELDRRLPKARKVWKDDVERKGQATAWRDNMQSIANQMFG